MREKVKLNQTKIKINENKNKPLSKKTKRPSFHGTLTQKYN